VLENVQQVKPIKVYENKRADAWRHLANKQILAYARRCRHIFHYLNSALSVELTQQIETCVRRAPRSSSSEEIVERCCNPIIAGWRCRRVTALRLCELPFAVRPPAHVIISFVVALPPSTDPRRTV